MARNSRRIYWDSCVLIHAIQQTPNYRPVLEAILDEARAGRVAIVTSALTIAEVRASGAGASPEQVAADDDVIDGMFRQPYVTVRVVDPPLAAQARRIGRKHGLKPADAVHVATALDLKADVMHTMDTKVLAKTGQIGEPGLAIKEPDWPVQNKLALDEPEDNH